MKLIFCAKTNDGYLIWFVICLVLFIVSIIWYFLNKVADEKKAAKKQAEKLEREKQEAERWEKMSPEEKEVETKWLENRMKTHQEFNNRIQAALNGRGNASSINAEMSRMEEEEKRWKTLSLEEKKQELLSQGIRLESDKSLNQKLLYNLPLSCPKCGALTNWKYADLETKESLDSAYTIMGSTTVFVNEKVIRRFICDKCGFEIKR